MPVRHHTTGRDYRPEPIDTARIELTPELRALLETLAHHNHEVWALQRLSEGWVWGPERRDSTREHPDLVPFAALPDSEKEYDLRTAEQLLKAMLARGWQLEPPSSGAEVPGGRGGPPAPRETLEAHREASQRLLRIGSPLLAYDLVHVGLERWPADLRLRQLEALALARSGATERASALLLGLYREGQLDAETVGLLAGRHKELAERATDPTARHTLRRSALRFYEMAYRSALDAAEGADAGFNGINAATLSLLEGNAPGAAELAREVREICRREIQRAGADLYWSHATLAEAALLLGEWGESEEHYVAAAGHGRGRWTEVASTRRQALAILRHLDRDPGFVERSLRIPAVGVVAAGARAAEAAIRRALQEELGRLDIGFGYASAGPGAELLFHEALLEMGRESQLVLPVSPEKFRDARLAEGAGAAWAERFDRILARAAGVHVASPTESGESSASGEYAALVRDGLAALRARFLDAAFVRLSPDPGAGSATGAGAPPRAAPLATSKRIVAVLFADALGYSSLEEDQIPAFVEHFLGAVARLVETSDDAPMLRNTWGDGLFFVFDRVDRAARFALDLNDAITKTDWTKKNLPPSLSLRIALHAGPVYPVFDPVIQAPGYVGTHVSRAARIEPITPPGHVYASAPFAALAAALGVEGLTFDYVGQTNLAKGYGNFPLYHVRRS